MQKNQKAKKPEQRCHLSRRLKPLKPRAHASNDALSIIPDHILYALHNQIGWQVFVYENPFISTVPEVNSASSKNNRPLMSYANCVRLDALPAMCCRCRQDNARCTAPFYNEAGCAQSIQWLGRCCTMDLECMTFW